MRRFGLLAAAAAACLLAADAVDRSKFRTCHDAGFCRRHRETKEEPEVRGGAASLSPVNLSRARSLSPPFRRASAGLRRPSPCILGEGTVHSPHPSARCAPPPPALAVPRPGRHRRSGGRQGHGDAARGLAGRPALHPERPGVRHGRGPGQDPREERHVGAVGGEEARRQENSARSRQIATPRVDEILPLPPFSSSLSSLPVCSPPTSSRTAPSSPPLSASSRRATPSSRASPGPPGPPPSSPPRTPWPPTRPRTGARTSSPSSTTRSASTSTSTATAEASRPSP
jgi:hypothetical protein